MAGSPGKSILPEYNSWSRGGPRPGPDKRAGTPPPARTMSLDDRVAAHLPGGVHWSDSRLQQQIQAWRQQQPGDGARTPPWPAISIPSKGSARCGAMNLGELDPTAWKPG